jgi:hypothetical protein
MTLIQTNFDPLKHGFRFPNNFELDLLLRVQLPIIKKTKYGDLIYGLCGGMCFSALDYFYEKKQIPHYFDIGEINYKFFSYLWKRQMDSLQGKTLIKMVKWMAYADSTLARLITKQESVTLRSRIDNKEPVVMVLLRVAGFSNPTLNHQVIATAYEFDPVHQDLTIYLYDPNHPGKIPTLSMNLSKPSQGINIQQSSREKVRGFYVIPYVWNPPLNF